MFEMVAGLLMVGAGVGVWLLVLAIASQGSRASTRLGLLLLPGWGLFHLVRGFVKVVDAWHGADPTLPENQPAEAAEAAKLTRKGIRYSLGLTGLAVAFFGACLSFSWYLTTLDYRRILPIQPQARSRQVVEEPIDDNRAPKPEVPVAPELTSEEIQAYVKSHAGVVEPQTSWDRPFTIQERDWDIAVDEGGGEVASMIRLAHTNNVQPIRSPTGDAFLVSQPNEKRSVWHFPPPANTSCKHHVGGLQRLGDRIVDQLLINIDFSPDGELVGSIVHDDQRDKRWAVVRRFNGSVVKVIPEAENIAFVSNSRVMVSHDRADGFEAEFREAKRERRAATKFRSGSDAEFERRLTRELAELHMTARSNHTTPKTVWFENVQTASRSKTIPVRRGGHIVLSPTRKLLIVVQPTDRVAANLQHPSSVFDGQSPTTEIDVYDTQNGERIASATYSGITVGFQGRCSLSGRRLGLIAKRHMTVISLTDGKVTANGSLSVADRAVATWLRGERLVCLSGGTIIDTLTGNLVGQFASSSPNWQPASQQWIADRYYRDGIEKSFAEFPTQSLINACDTISDSEQNAFAARQVKLSVTGYPFDDDLPRICAKAILGPKYNWHLVRSGEVPVVHLKLGVFENGPSTLLLRGETSDGTTFCRAAITHNLAASEPRQPNEATKARARELLTMIRRLEFDNPVLVPKNPSHWRLPRTFDASTDASDLDNQVVLKSEAVQVKNDSSLATKHKIPLSN